MGVKIELQARATVLATAIALLPVSGMTAASKKVRQRREIIYQPPDAQLITVDKKSNF